MIIINVIVIIEKKLKKKYQEKLKSEGKITEKEKLSQRREKIKDLLVEGLEQKDICLLVNISKRTYIRDRKYLKEQGLIEFIELGTLSIKKKVIMILATE